MSFFSPGWPATFRSVREASATAANVATALTVVMLIASSSAAQEAPRTGTRLRTGAVMLRPEEVRPALAPLWPCPHSDDEFAQRRCEAATPALRRSIRDTVFVAFVGATVAPYDFTQHRFDVQIGGIVVNGPDEIETGEAPPWSVDGTGQAMLVVPSPPTRRSPAVGGSLPADWTRLVTAHVPFADDASAEAWRDFVRPATDGEPRSASLLGMIVFRVIGTWSAIEPPSLFEVAIRRGFARWARGVGVRPPPHQGRRIEGVRMRPLAWALLAPLPGDTTRAGLVARGALGGASRDAQVAAATLDALDTAFRTASNPGAAPTPLAVYGYVGGGGWDCSGQIPDANPVMNEAQRQVRNCYERQLTTNSTLRGTVIVSMKVGANGVVQEVQIGGTLRDNDVFTCVRTVVQALRFAAPVGGACAVVQQPFNLTPNDAPDGGFRAAANPSATQPPPTSPSTPSVPVVTRAEGLSAVEVRAVAARERHGVTASCWEAATRGLAEAPTLPISVSIKINEAGAVTSATVHGDDLGALHDCIAARVRTWTFPTSGGTTTADVPFLFTPLAVAPPSGSSGPDGGADHPR